MLHNYTMYQESIILSHWYLYPSIILSHWYLYPSIILSHRSNLAVSRTLVDDCGLGGLVQVNAMFGDGRSCRGMLSDWSPFSCSKSAQMTLTFQGCRDEQEATNQG